jgi:hypothetical protein
MDRQKRASPLDPEGAWLAPEERCSTRGTADWLGQQFVDEGVRIRGSGMHINYTFSRPWSCLAMSGRDAD